MSAEILEELVEAVAVANAKLDYLIDDEIEVVDAPDTEADDVADGYIPTNEFTTNPDGSPNLIAWRFFAADADRVFNGDMSIQVIRRNNGDDYAEAVLDYIENNPAYYDGV